MTAQDAVDLALAGLPPATGVIGVGIDLETVDRWNTEQRWDALFSEEELAYCRAKADPALHLAGTWCIKEAVFKACSGHASFDLRDVTVTHRSDGSPQVHIRGNDELERRVLVSVAHSFGGVAAVAVLTGDVRL